MGKFFNVIIFSLCLLLAACSDNNNEPDEILPIHFGSSDYTVILGVSHAIPFTDGGGDYVEVQAVTTRTDLTRLKLRPTPSRRSPSEWL